MLFIDIINWHPKCTLFLLLNNGQHLGHPRRPVFKGLFNTVIITRTSGEASKSIFCGIPTWAEGSICAVATLRAVHHTSVRWNLKSPPATVPDIFWIYVRRILNEQTIYESLVSDLWTPLYITEAEGCWYRRPPLLEETFNICSGCT